MATGSDGFRSALLITTGVLPQRFRDEMRLPWDAGKQRRFEALMAVLGTTNRLMPRIVREFPFSPMLWDLDRRMEGSSIGLEDRSLERRANMAYRGEPGEIPVQAHHIAVMLHCDGREYRVGYQVAGRIGLVAEFSQQHQVSGAGVGRKVVGLGGDGVDECECSCSR